MNILVTGASGLVGQALCTHLERNGHTVLRAVRRASTADELPISNIDGATSWRQVLREDLDAIVHLAARVHVMQEESADADTLYRQTNTEGTLNLARQCAAAGVRRFVFVSSIKVLGEGRDSPYQPYDEAHPEGPYAISKWEAEQGLREIAATSGMEVVIVRPPLVYGPGVRANFLRLMMLVDRGWPLPFGSINNRRSLVFLGNLVDAIASCLTHPNATGKTYHVSDGEDVSTPELIRRLAHALGKPPRLLPVPRTWMRLAGRGLSKGPAVERLLGSLTVDSGSIRRELGWSPPYTMQNALEQTAVWYHEARRKGDL